MTFDLIRGKRSDGFNNNGCCTLLNAAERHGWEPVGTVPGDDWRDAEEWSGGYFTNDGQRVTKEDALALAIAIEKAVAENDPELKEFPLRCMAFAEFCREGGFEIW